MATCWTRETTCAWTPTGAKARRPRTTDASKPNRFAFVIWPSPLTGAREHQSVRVDVRHDAKIERLEDLLVFVATALSAAHRHDAHVNQLAEIDRIGPDRDAQEIVEALGLRRDFRAEVAPGPGLGGPVEEMRRPENRRSRAGRSELG